MQMNSLEVYRDCGNKAGKASRQKDYGTMNFHASWLERALRMEKDTEHRISARQAYNQAYRQATGVILHR